MRWKSIALACAALVAWGAHAQTETLMVKRAAELRQGPSETTATVVSLPAQTQITRLPERQGPWMHVKTDAGQVGWIHMFDVGSAASTTSSGGGASGALRGLTNLFVNNGAKTTTTATSTVGIRGLGAEDIANSQPNMQTLKQAEGLRVDAAQAKRFASDEQLTARAVDPLPAPQPPAAAPTGDDVFGTGKRRN
jgi:hypothetical protein